MSKPTMIKDFCGTDWYIKETTRQKIKEVNGDDDDCDGCCHYDSQTVYVYHRLPEYRKRVTIVHELMHVIADYVGMKEEHEEETIRSLEHHVYKLIRTFPEKYK